MSRSQVKHGTGPKILVVGGGSVLWVPNILRDILLTPMIANPTIVLYDINRAAAELTGAFLRKLTDHIGVRARVQPTDNRARAFDAANYAIVTISTGGFDAMQHDLSIPQRYRVYHTVGDTVGPGGWSRFFRNYPVFVDLAKELNRLAPGCVVLNYTNPMCTLTDVLARHCQGPVVGLCHGLFENIDFLKKFTGIKRESELCLRYAGLNHFFWVTQAIVKGKDQLAVLRRRAARESLTSLAGITKPDASGFTSCHEVATELLQTTGALPYLADRHTSEFLPRLMSDLKIMKRYKLQRTTIARRRQSQQHRRRRLERMIAGKIRREYSERTRETAADIINAHLNGTPFEDVGNVPNIGQIDDLPRGVVVETAVRVDRHGIQPLAAHPLPDLVLGLLQPHALAYRMQVKAAMQGDLELALQALRLDPSCSHLSDGQVRDMGTQLLKAHRRYLSGVFD